MTRERVNGDGEVNKRFCPKLSKYICRQWARIIPLVSGFILKLTGQTNLTSTNATAEALFSVVKTSYLKGKRRISLPSFVSTMKRNFR